MTRSAREIAVFFRLSSAEIQHYAGVTYGEVARWNAGKTGTKDRIIERGVYALAGAKVIEAGIENEEYNPLTALADWALADVRGVHTEKPPEFATL
jgi:hypothetical protein